MNDLPLPADILFGSLLALILLSAMFSGTETGMMALNRYRLRHLANTGHRSARRAANLLQRPDRLIGVVLLGNNLVNNLAATIATVLAIHYFGESPTTVVMTSVVVTVVFLIFAEVTPKTYAALRPERVAFPMVWVLGPLLALFSPFVYAINAVGNVMLRLARVNAATEGAQTSPLSPAELRSIVNEASGLVPETHQRMLLNILDLEDVSVDDIMIPRNEIAGIDIDDDVDDIIETIQKAQHTRLPVWKGDINNLLGILHLRKTNALVTNPELTRAEILRVAAEPYFVPQGTPLHTQLLNFRQVRRRIGMVVDEYGDVQGMVTLEDILEEIVGEFTTSVAEATPDIHPQADGSFLVEGGASLRDINRTLNWKLPATEAKTLNGLILEQLEAMPEPAMSLRVSDYVIEVLRVEDNRVHTARLQRFTPSPQQDWISGE